MKEVQEAHARLQRVILNGRILVNGMPLTANELSGILRDEQRLYGLAAEFITAKAEKTKPEKDKK